MYLTGTLEATFYNCNTSSHLSSAKYLAPPLPSHPFLSRGRHPNTLSCTQAARRPRGSPAAGPSTAPRTPGGARGACCREDGDGAPGIPVELPASARGHLNSRNAPRAILKREHLRPAGTRRAVQVAGGPRGGACHHSVPTEPHVSRGVTRRKCRGQT